ncbi:MAG: CDP-alcohol phosphatidyltransferase family protein [Cypionkella sp.]
MIDAKLLPLQRRLLTTPAQILVARGVSADTISLAGFGIGVLIVPALWLGFYKVALLILVINRLADGLDGAVARATSPTDRGAFLDIALDFMFYALVPVGFALADPAQNALAAALLIASFIGTGSSFLAFSVIAAKRGLRAYSYPAKGIYYLGGLTEGAETIALFALMCVFPALFPPLALIFAAACALTTVLRWRFGWDAFTDSL